jgi:hypothetical protein
MPDPQPAIMQSEFQNALQTFQRLTRDHAQAYHPAWATR